MKSLADPLRQQQINYRRHLHQNPELSFQEVKTAAWIREKLNALSIQVLEGYSGNSVAGLLDGGKPGPIIAFRADIDALPLNEETQVPFKSQVPNVMHACGHDCHTATLICLAEILAKNKELIKGKVKFIFQQAEELLPGGAKTLVAEGVMQDVDMIFAYHAGGEIGTVNIDSGPRSAAIATYEINITGKGGHGGMPDTAIDPITAACAVVTAIHQLVPQTVSPYEVAVVTVAYIYSGAAKAPNIIPGSAVLGGNVRCMNNELRSQLLQRISAVAESICKAKSCECTFSQEVAYPAVINDKQAADVVISAAEAMEYKINKSFAAMAGEDFSYYTLEKPAAFFTVGFTNPADSSTSLPPHNSRFCVDESGLQTALEMMLATYLKATGQAD